MKVTPREKLQNFAFVIPALLLFLVFSLYPILRTFQISVFDWSGLGPMTDFVWLENYRYVLTEARFWKAMGNAGIITLLALTLQNGLALLLALLVTRGIRGDNAYRTIFFLPPILSGIVVGLIWKFVFDGEIGPGGTNVGILNHLLTMIGITNPATNGGLPIFNWNWLAEIRTALLSVATVHMWKGFGYGFIIFLAGLQTIPVELYEAAEVDGADSWQQFKKITFPLLIPIISIVMILTILGSMQVFDLIYTMTRGGPAGHTDVPINQIYNYMSGSREFGKSTAMSVVFGMVLLIVSFAQIFISKKLNYNDNK